MAWSSISFAQTPVTTPMKLDWFGDLRYRLAKGHEDIDEDRSYQQLRARLGLKAEVNESVHAVIRLATANSAVSQDQTLGDPNDPGMPRRAFGLDWAYMDWQFHEFGNVWAGRTANPFWSPAGSQLVFSDELAFEGAAIKWNPRWSHTSAFINIGGFIISENYAAPQDIVDTGLVGGDAGFVFKGATWAWTTHVGNYYWLNLQDKAISSVDKNAAVDPYSYPIDSYRGNSVYPNDPLLPADQRKYFFENKYVLLEVGSEWRQQLGPFEYVVFFDWVQNSKVSTQRIGVDYGASLRWKFLTLSYAQTSKARDAVVAAFTDYYMNGGGTDNRGYRLQLSALVAKNTTIGVTQYKAKRGYDTVQREFTLTQADFAVSF